MALEKKKKSSPAANSAAKAPDVKPQEQPQTSSPASILSENKHVVSAVGDVVKPREAKDDPEITRHKDYDIGDHSVRIDGRRQFQPDMLCRQLNCTCYEIDKDFPWGDNPCGGPPISITYTRYFGEVKVLFDHFNFEDLGTHEKSMERMNALVDYKRKLAHDHGYRYIYQHTGKVLTPEAFAAMMKEEDDWLKSR